MADILICAAPQNEADVRRLGEALAGLGYSVLHEDSPAHDAAAFADVTARIGEAKAVIVLWSAAAAGSDWVRAEANVASGQGKLVQLSADGRPPPLPFDPARMVSILTWRGEEDHPGWRGVKARIAELCGPPRAAAPPPPPPRAAPAAPTPAEVRRSGGGKAVFLVIGLLVAAGAGLAAYFWLFPHGPAATQSVAADTAAPAPAPPPAPQFPAGFTPPPDAQAAVPAAAPGPDAFNRQARIADPAGYALVRSAPSDLGLTIARVDAGETVSTYPQSATWWRVRTASGQIGYVPAASLRLTVTASAPATESPPPSPTAARPAPRSRIVKENSAVMSAFCASAGRGTPQCRAYRQEGGR